MNNNNSNPQLRMVKFRSSNGTLIEAKGENPAQLIKENIEVFQAEKRRDNRNKFLLGVGIPITVGLIKFAGGKLYNLAKNKWYHPTGTGANIAPIVTGADICNSPEPIRRWILPFLREGGTIVMYATKKTGKTTEMLNLACSICAGECDESLPSYNPVKVPVLYYNMEMDNGELTDSFGQNPNFQHVKLVNKNDWLSPKEVMDNVRCNLKQILGSSIVVIDNATSCGLNSTPDAARELFRSINNIKNERLQETGYYTTFVLITHTPKDFKPNKIDSNDMFGSTVIPSLANATIGLYKTPVKNQVLMKVMDIRDAPEPEECYLMERISNPGHLHFKFLQMVKEEDVLEPKSKSSDIEPELLRNYRKMSDADREEVHDFWRAKREEGLSYDDINDLTINVLHINVSTQTIWNFFTKK